MGIDTQALRAGSELEGGKYTIERTLGMGASAVAIATASTGLPSVRSQKFGWSQDFKRSAFDSFDLFCSGDLKAGTAFAVIMGAKSPPFVWHPAFPSLYSR